MDTPERYVFIIIILETRKVRLRLLPHKAHHAIHPHKLGTTQFSRQLHPYNPLTPSVTLPRTRPGFLLCPCPHPHRLWTLHVTESDSSLSATPALSRVLRILPDSLPNRILSPEPQDPRPDLRLARPKPHSPADKDDYGEPESLRLRTPWLASTPRGLLGSAGLSTGQKLSVLAGPPLFWLRTTFPISSRGPSALFALSLLPQFVGLSPWVRGRSLIVYVF